MQINQLFNLNRCVLLILGIGHPNAYSKYFQYAHTTKDCKIKTCSPEFEIKRTTDFMDKYIS